MVAIISFSEMAKALGELGFTEQEFGNAELCAHRLERVGFSRQAAG